MATAEDDEIVLQEVIIDPKDVKKPLVQRSDSLQVPGAEGSDTKQPTLSRLLRRSPKIAPKFPREKLKSMFKRRKLSSAFPFFKLKAVKFTKETKDDPINQSLLDLSASEAIEVAITLSTPELTEIEKETGVHPYYFTQQTITSAKQLTSGKAVTVRQPKLERSGSEEKEVKVDKVEQFLVRSSSLPNISPTDYVADPVIESSLKKIAEIAKKKKNMKKAKTKKKSPSPNKTQQADDSSSEVQDSEEVEPATKKKILPQITVTRCGRKSSEEFDLSHSPSKQSGSDSDSKTKKEGDGRRDSTEQKDKQPERILKQRTSDTPSVKEKVVTTTEPHSTTKGPQKSTHQATRFEKEPKDTSKKVQPKRRSPPPPRPDNLRFKRHPSPVRKIAGIEIKADVDPSSPTTESPPSSPISFIPSTSFATRTQPVPKTPQLSESASSASPRHSLTDTSTPSVQYPRAQADTTITIGDSTEDLTQIEDQTRPPDPPQRHIPRTTPKGKK